jgi:hypothetical protein
VDEDRFWRIVDATLSAARNRKGQHRLLHDQLIALPAEEVAGFQWLFRRMIERSDCPNVEAAWDIIDGCGADDGYHDFRCWLISRGRAAFEAALADPDSLADVVRPDENTHFQDFDIADIVYERLTGEECPEGPGPLEEPAGGEDWDAHDGEEQRRRMPRLWQMFDEDGE